MTPTWAQIGYLVAAVCFILALKGLSSPRTARDGNLIGAAGALLAVVVVLTSAELDHLALILGAIAVGIGRRRADRAPGADDRDAAAGGAVQRRRWRRRRDRRAARARPRRRARDSSLAAALVTLIIGAVSFSGSAVTFAKLQELMTTRPVLLPAGPILFGVTIVATVGLAAVVVRGGRHRRAARPPRPCSRSCSRSRSGCCSCCRSAAPTCRS